MSDRALDSLLVVIVRGMYRPWHDTIGTGWHLAPVAQMALSEHLASYRPMRAAAIGTHLSTGTSQEHRHLHTHTASNQM